jgi:hypothetical protein
MELGDEGLVESAEAFCKAWKWHFETDASRAPAAGFIRVLSAIYFYWAGLGEIKRSEADVQFDVAVGITSPYQLFMLREGKVLARLTRSGVR